MEAPGYCESNAGERARLDFCLRIESAVLEETGERLLTVGWSSGYCAPIDGKAIWIEPGACPCRPNDLVMISCETGRIRCGRMPGKGEGVFAWVLPEAGEESEDAWPTPWLCAYRPDGHHLYV